MLSRKKGGNMADRKDEIMHHLSGDWTISGVDSQFTSLNKTLSTLSSSQNKILLADCTHIDSIDMSGLQLLYVWMECAKIQDITIQLINQPDSMQQCIHRLGFQHSFQNNPPVTF